MRYLICYDIADDRKREHLSKTLLNYGQRIQESVFAADLDEPLAAQLIHKLTAMMEPQMPDEKVHVFRLCKQCAESGLCLGAAEIHGDPEYYVV